MDRYASQLNPRVGELLPEALALISGDGRSRIAETVDLGRIVGQTTTVRTRPGDEIVFARRALRRGGVTRFVKNRQAEPTRLVTVVLEVAAGRPGYVCASAWIGGQAEPEPWDPNATAGSISFWRAHAVVLDSEPVQRETETPICPWPER